jgi:hypothetical protein
MSETEVSDGSNGGQRPVSQNQNPELIAQTWKNDFHFTCEKLGLLPVGL